MPLFSSFICPFFRQHYIPVFLFLSSLSSYADIKTKRNIFKIHTGRMSLSDDVDLEVFVMSKDDLSGKFDFFQDFFLNIFNLSQLPNDR